MSTNDVTESKVYLSTAQVARLVGVSVSYVEHDRIRPQPRFPFIRIGRMVRYDKSIIDAKMTEAMVK